MLLLVSGASKTMQKYAHSPHLGVLHTPHTGNKIGKLSLRFDEHKFVRMLNRMRGMKPMWVVAPDVPFNAMETTRLFEIWEPVIRSYGFRVAYVTQDGQEEVPVPWDRMDCLFIGGTTKYKLGAYVRRLVQEAKRCGKWIHMGRVNSVTRIQYAQSIGVDSVDGTGYSMAPETNIPKALRVLENEQLALQLGL